MIVLIAYAATLPMMANATTTSGAAQIPPVANQVSASTPSPSPACDTAAHRAFDFWIGEWDVTNTQDGTPAGHSLIESVYYGCTIRENWREPGFTGGSLNTLVARDGHWHQLWTDSSGAWREFIGGPENGRMVLVWSHPSAADPTKTVRVRLTYTPNPDGSVRQYSDQSIDGMHWTERYDYTYRHPAKAG